MTTELSSVPYQRSPDTRGDLTETTELLTHDTIDLRPNADHAFPSPNIFFPFSQGDWRGISRHFVQSRTPTQVASHAQKYFIRQNNVNKRKRRSSLFDIVGDPTSADAAPSVDAKGPAPQVGGLSMAFAGQMGGYNPAAMAAPPAFVAKGSAAGETDVGAAGEAAAATIAALSMAGSPAATAGYQAAAAAASSAPARFPAVPVPPATAGRDAAAAQAAQAAQAQQGFAAMMAQMGAMGQMNPGAMGSFPPAAANWMLTYQHFLQQITAAAQQHQAAAPGAGPGAMPPFGLSFPPFGAAATPAGSLFRPTALHAAQPTAAPVVSGAPAAPAAQATSEEKTAVAA